MDYDRFVKKDLSLVKRSYWYCHVNILVFEKEAIQLCHNVKQYLTEPLKLKRLIQYLQNQASY